MGVYLSSPNTEKHTEEGNHKQKKYVASSMQGWRTNMEDAHIMDGQVAEDTAVFGVFDGHGGKEVALFVQQHFIIELKKNKAFQEKKFEDALYQTFLKMDELLQTEEGKKEVNEIKNGSMSGGDGSNQESCAGCTANVSLIYKNTIYCANAGDSRTVLSRNGNMFEMSYDHKPDNEKEKNRVKNAGGFISDGRINGNLNLSRAMGDLEYKRNTDMKVDEQLIIACPDIKVEELKEEDEFILMGCDGIWETKSNQELITYCRDKLKQKIPLKTIVESLLDDILAPDTSNGYGCDNMTSLIVTFRDLA